MSPPHHVLIVDDMADTRTLLRLLLSHKGLYAVHEAENGQQALEKVAQHMPDLIVLDYMMPDMSGADVCQQLRARSETAHLPIIVLTARIDYETRDQALAAGADVFMCKPLKPGELLETVRRLIAAREGILEAD